jgi:hypothetical protein
VIQAGGVQFHDVGLAPPPCVDAAQPSKLSLVLAQPQAIPTCTPEQYELRVEDGAAASSVRLRIEAVNLQAPCYLATDVKVALLDASGQPLEIEGNGQTLHLEGQLPNTAVVTGVVWQNWCGEAGEVQLELADSTGGTSQGGPIPVPGCNAPDQPSTLRPFADEELGGPATPTPVAGGDLPPCDTGRSYRLESSVVVMDEEIWVGIGAFYVGQPCHLTDTVTLTIMDDTQQPLDIEGNAVSVPIDLDLTGQQSDAARFAWRNWCGASDSFTIELAGSSQGAGRSLDQAPACVDPDLPSTLTVMQGGN